MERVERILLHLPQGDESAPALQRVAELAARHGAAVSVVDVLPTLSWYARLRGTDTATLTATRTAERERELRAAVEGQPELADRTTILIRSGEPFVELIREALRQRSDLLVTTAHGRGGDLLDRTGMHLIRKAPCPVWILRGREPKRWKRVLVAVKPEVDNPVGMELSRRLIATGARVAEDEGAELHVLRVWGSRLERMLERRMRRDRWEQIRDELREQARAQVIDLVEPWHDQIGGRLWLRQGDPETLIARFAARKKIDLLVIGTIARSGLEGVFIGNVAERVFATVHCAVLALKPEGFVSPIRLPEGED